MRGDEGISGKDDAEQVVAADGNVLWRLDLLIAVAGFAWTGLRKGDKAIGQVG